MQLRLLAAGSCVLALMAGCDGGASQGSGAQRSPQLTPTASTTPSVTPSPTLASGCPNEPGRFGARRLTGDIDGDGAPEQVRLGVDRSGAPGCQVFVGAHSSSLDDVVAINEPNVSFDLGLPALDSVRPVGFGSGDEVVLVLSAGASTQFFGLVSVADGELAQVTIEDGPYGNAFPYGGSAAHLEASDCASPPDIDMAIPTIVISSATTQGDRYRLERRFFGVPEGSELIPVPEATERSVVSFEELVSYPEFGEAPFGHCR